MGIQNTYPEYDDWLKTNMQKLFESVELLPKEEVRDIIEVAGRAIWQAAKAQAVPEGYVLVSRKMPDEVNDHLWDFMTDNFVCVNEDGDSFMACDDFDLEKLYVELVKAQEPAND